MTRRRNTGMRLEGESVRLIVSDDPNEDWIFTFSDAEAARRGMRQVKRGRVAFEHPASG